MKVFLSWSGPKSREVASAFHDWLPKVIQAVRPFMSSGDIEKGDRWEEVLTLELGKLAYGIIFITQSNFNKPWINFEAGAISKALDKSYVSPFLFNVAPSLITGPLQQFQSTVYDSNHDDDKTKNEILGLLISINNKLELERQISFEVLNEEFGKWWDDLNGKLKKAADVKEQNETGFDWLDTTDDLVGNLKDIHCKEVWVISPDIYRNVLTTNFKATMHYHIENRKAHYKFLIPSKELPATKRGLCELAKLKTKDIHLTTIENEKFRCVAVTDYIIVNPSSAELQVFFEVPVSARGYWVRVSDKAAIGFEMRFGEWLNKKGDELLWFALELAL